MAIAGVVARLHRPANFTSMPATSSYARHDSKRRIFLHGAIALDTLYLADEHKGLIMIEDADSHGVLIDKKPAGLAAADHYLIDPLGNLVTYFGPDINPCDMVDDIKHLLKLSRIAPTGTD